jgi:parallel beta-helix repeat protein
LNKGIVLCIVFLFIGLSFTSISGNQINNQTVKTSGRGDILYVGGSGEGNYTKIQDAIVNASDGDTVLVFPDSSPYYESIEIDKSINLIGGGQKSTVIDGIGYTNVIYVSAGQVNISGFTIKNGYYGIHIKGNNGNKIINNNVRLNNYGIYIIDSRNNFITGNTIYSNNIKGLILTKTKIHLYESFDSSPDNNIIKGNNIYNNGNAGITLQFSDSNTISDNCILDSNYGIKIEGSSYNTINGNNIKQNNIIGICIDFYFDGVLTISSNQNKIFNNNFLKNEQDAYFIDIILGNIIFRRNTWIQNYWNSSKLFIKFIFGILSFGDFSFRWFNIDRDPATEPYVIITEQGCGLERKK